MQCLTKCTFLKYLYLLAQMKSTSVKTLIFLVFLCFPMPKSYQHLHFHCILIHFGLCPKVSRSRFRSYRLPQTSLGASQTTVWEEGFGAHCPGVTFCTILASNSFQIWGHVGVQERPNAVKISCIFRSFL